LIFEPYSSEISSRIGPTARHGPHHSAQKSTKTGVLLFRTSASNVAVVTLLVAIVVLLFFVGIKSVKGKT
jgi:hypothetical protein